MKYTKTEIGQAAFKQRSPLLNARQRSAFIVFDGNKSLEQVKASVGVSQEDVDHLLAHGLLAVAAPFSGESTVALWSADDPWGPGKKTDAERYVEAMRLATRLTADLGLRGFRLNLALEAATGFDGLVALLPKIQDAVGNKACKQLERVLKGGTSA